MKTGLTTSVVMHAVVLGFGLLSLSAPTAFEVADVESLPVDIIPVESITQIQKGDKKATLSEKPAPVRPPLFRRPLRSPNPSQPTSRSPNRSSNQSRNRRQCLPPRLLRSRSPSRR